MFSENMKDGFELDPIHLQELAEEKARCYLAILAMLPKSPNSDLEKIFAVVQVAQKHGGYESLVWSLKLEEKDDLPKCHELK